LLPFFGKETAGDLPVFSVVCHALTAFSLPVAGIGAGTFYGIVASHDVPS